MIIRMHPASSDSDDFGCFRMVWMTPITPISLHHHPLSNHTFYYFPKSIVLHPMLFGALSPLIVLHWMAELILLAFDLDQHQALHDHLLVW